MEFLGCTMSSFWQIRNRSCPCWDAHSLTLWILTFLLCQLEQLLTGLIWQNHWILHQYMLAMFKTCSEDKKKRIWSFLLGSALRRFICLFAVGLFLVGVANWKFWDAKWSQIGILGRWLVVNRHSWDADWFVRCMRGTSLKVSRGELMVKYEIVVLACQVSPFHLKLTRINSEMNCVAQMYGEPEARHETLNETLNATSHVSRATTYTIFAFCVCIILCEKRKKISLLLRKKVLFCRVFVLFAATNRWFITKTFKDLMRFKNNKRT